ncbi:hypothetical protein OC846_003330 [Tilletia horrida]|uniref:Trafficking protein particle complex subunit 2-like protein n=1 Tax=Tilletia horrida TaxID=155126 RepID=A0AAN6GPA4_9BASI|nr:hypothetical protein OC846_003330 [Tilletia horrida]KAK0568631.1 hypothetical protein OC861_001793 [Tilletia horrida]
MSTIPAASTSTPHYASTGIACIAIISARNTPLYLRSFPTSPAQASSSSASSSETNVRYEYIANSALDLVEERVNRHAEHYLGLLMTTEDLAIYGFQTSSRIKFLLMLPSTDLYVRDIDMLTIFRALHTAFLSYTANPFHLLPPIHSFSSSSTAITHQTPSAYSQPPSIFSADPALEQVAALQALSARPILSERFEREMEGVVGWVSVPTPSTAAVGGPTSSTPKEPIGAGTLPALPPTQA